MQGNGDTEHDDDIPISGAWCAALVAGCLHPVQVAITNAARPCFVSHERGADQMLWAVGRVAAAQSSAKRGARGPRRWIDWPLPKARPETNMSKEAIQRGLP